MTRKRGEGFGRQYSHPPERHHQNLRPVVANDKISLEVDRGEILALLGENGSGKTTLMNMLSGIYFPDAGQIWVDGKEVTIAPPGTPLTWASA